MIITGPAASFHTPNVEVQHGEREAGLGQGEH